MKPDFNPQLYHSEPETILELLQKAVEPVVMIVAHNPGIAYFAQAAPAGVRRHPAG